MSAPGTRIVAEEVTTRRVDGLDVEQKVIHWNETDGISVDYRAGDVDLWADSTACTSHDKVLTDAELRELLVDYGVRLDVTA
jgi:hypothetical protein